MTADKYLDVTWAEYLITLHTTTALKNYLKKPYFFKVKKSRISYQTVS